MTPQQRAALKLAIDVILETAREAGPMGAPSGIVYAALMAHGMTLTTYQSLIDALVRTGKIKIELDCIHAL